MLTLKTKRDLKMILVLFFFFCLLLNGDAISQTENSNEIVIYPISRNANYFFAELSKNDLDSFLIRALKSTIEIDIFTYFDFDFDLFEAEVDKNSRLVRKKRQITNYRKVFDREKKFLRVIFDHELTETKLLLFVIKFNQNFEYKKFPILMTKENLYSHLVSNSSYLTTYRRQVRFLDQTYIESDSASIMYRLIVQKSSNASFFDEASYVLAAEAYPYVVKRGQNLILDLKKENPLEEVKIDLNNDQVFDLTTTNSTINIDYQTLKRYLKRQKVNLIRICSRKNCILSNVVLYDTTYFEYETEIDQNFAYEFIRNELTLEEKSAIKKFYGLKSLYSHLKNFRLLFDQERPKLLISFSNMTYEYALDKIITALIGFDLSRISENEIQHVNLEMLNSLELSVNFYPYSYSRKTFLHVINHEYYYAIPLAMAYYYGAENRNEATIDIMSTNLFFIHEGYLTAFENPIAAIKVSNFSNFIDEIETYKEAAKLPYREFRQRYSLYEIGETIIPYASYAAHYLYWFFEDEFNRMTSSLIEQNQMPEEMFVDFFGFDQDYYLEQVNYVLREDFQLKRPNSIRLVNVINEDGQIELEFSISGETDYFVMAYVADSLSPLAKTKVKNNSTFRVSYTGYDSILFVVKSIDDSEKEFPLISRESYYKFLLVLDTDSNFLIFEDESSNKLFRVRSYGGLKFDIFDVKIDHEKICLDLRKIKPLIEYYEYGSEIFEASNFLFCKLFESSQENENLLRLKLKGSTEFVIEFKDFDYEVLSVYVHN